MNQANFVQTEGYPLKAERLQELQTAYSIFNSLGSLAGNLTIISGCDTVGTNVTDGFVHINGEILEFKGGAVTGTSKVIIKEEKVDRAFKSDVVKTVYTVRYATFGTAAVYWNWSDFQRPLETKQLQSILNTINTSLTTINNTLSAHTTKLDGIEDGAEKNVQPNFTQTDNTKDDYIKNKPTNILTYLARGQVDLPDFLSDTLQTVTIANVGTNGYMVIGSLVSTGSNYNNDNDVIWTIKNKTNVSFDIALREVSGNVQSLRFEYMLLPKY